MEEPVVSSWAVAALLVAPFVGSFLGVLISRLPAGRAVVWSRSACESCGATLGARDLVPLASFLALGGRCRACRAQIPAFHPVIELLALIVAGWAVLGGNGEPARIWADCVLGWGLLALAWIDWRHLRLPDPLTLPLIPAGLAVTLWLESDHLAAHALGAAAGYVAFRGLASAYRRLRGREGLGHGDAKLLAVAGAWLGLEALPMVVLLAALLGLTAASAAALARGGRLHATLMVPFGPALALALWFVRLHGAWLPVDGS